jgi:hypothetical protein
VFSSIGYGGVFHSVGRVTREGGRGGLVYEVRGSQRRFEVCFLEEVSRLFEGSLIQCQGWRSQLRDGL